MNRNIEKTLTNADRIRSMTDEELAEYLFYRGNGCEYCYGICAFQDECDGQDHAQEFCIEQIVKWLRQEAEGGDQGEEDIAAQEYQAAVVYQEYCERYEPTYNPEDGSM